jgi:hypothetical protein
MQMVEPGAADAIHSSTNHQQTINTIAATCGHPKSYL